MAKTVPATLGDESESLVINAYPAVGIWYNKSGTLTPLFNFYGTDANTATWPTAETGGGSEAEKHSITRGDGVILECSKQTKKIDLSTGATVQVAVEEDSNFTKLGTVSFTALVAPKLHSGATWSKNTWSKFIELLTQPLTDSKAVKDLELLVAMPAGQTYADAQSSTGKVDGWVWMVGKITSEISHSSSGSNPSSLEITISSYKPHGLEATDLTGLTAIPLEVPMGDSAYLTINTPTITAGQATLLLNGKLVMASV